MPLRKDRNVCHNTINSKIEIFKKLQKTTSQNITTKASSTAGKTAAIISLANIKISRDIY